MFKWFRKRRMAARMQYVCTRCYQVASLADRPLMTLVPNSGCERCG